GAPDRAYGDGHAGRKSRRDWSCLRRFHQPFNGLHARPLGGHSRSRPRATAKPRIRWSCPMTRQKRLGFFTRLLDDASPAERYRLATEQVMHAESLGFDAAWVAQ